MTVRHIVGLKFIPSDSATLTTIRGMLEMNSTATQSRTGMMTRSRSPQ